MGKAAGAKGGRQDVGGTIDDFDRIDWQDRVVRIVFDTNVHTNESVARARICLAKELCARGALVQLVDLPQDCGVNGIDDLLAKNGPEWVLDLLNQPASIPHRELKQSEQLLKMADCVELLHTAEGKAFGRIPVKSHLETWALESVGFKRWLLHRFYDVHHKPPGSQALQDAIGVLIAKAQFGAPEAPIFVRVAGYEQRIYIDLADEDWRVVEVDATGWRVVRESPVHFRRHRGMKQLPEPQRGGSLDLLRDCVNIGKDHNWILCRAWLLAACRPDGPYPVLVLQGEQGSAKSTLARLLRRVIDPSAAMIRTTPKDERDLVIAANNSWVIAYDNLSGIPHWLSDALCRLATGGGFSTRELYTDSDEVLFDAVRPIVLNGIDHLAERPDLADRSLILHLPVIDDSRRIDEATLMMKFETSLPLILGALFTAVSGALRLLPSTRLLKKPRMADFALWATAGEQDLGLAAGSFLRAYAGNRAESVQHTLDTDQVAGALIELLAKNDSSWTGTCQGLQGCLEEFVDERIKQSKEWPTSPRGLSNRLRRLATFLRSQGVEVAFHGKQTHGQRLISITRIGTQNTATIATTATEDLLASSDQAPITKTTGGSTLAAVALDSGATLPPPPRHDRISTETNIFHPSGGSGGDSGGPSHPTSPEWEEIEI